MTVTQWTEVIGCLCACLAVVGIPSIVAIVRLNARIAVLESNHKENEGFGERLRGLEDKLGKACEDLAYIRGRMGSAGAK